MYGNNYYNPFNYQMYRPPRVNLLNNVNRLNNIKGGFFGNLFHKFNFNNFLTGASKTLNVINQAIPIYYQVRPMFNNAKTMFKIIGAIKEDDNPKVENKNNYQNISTSSSSNKIENEPSYENPVFFI